MSNRQSGGSGRASFARHSGLILAALSLTGCAAIPDVTMTYQPVDWSVGVSVIHTFTCTRDGKRVLIARSATFSPVYKADAKASPIPLRIKDMDRFFADSDLTVAFTDDGRLKSVNQSTTGQGEDITKAVATTAATIGSAGVLKNVPMLDAAPKLTTELKGTFSLYDNRVRKTEVAPAASEICGVVSRWSTASGPKDLPQISVIQIAGISRAVTAMDLEAADDQATRLMAEFRAIHLDLGAKVDAQFVKDNYAAPQPVNAKSTAGFNEVALQIQQMQALSLTATSALDASKPAGSGTVVVPMKDPASYIVLPIPKAALFGKQNFSVVLADSGRITTLGYGRSVGASGALNALSSVVGEPAAEDTAEQAALKAAADKIAQQARLSSCIQDPSNCPK
ncbi:hypothetical protein SNE35_29655 [Paucibacter sp. R3-3]|uniref:Uncharacterized protein n=1 Tax=Roseateles agri TaxID=3098619 RepID=A0ABU5DQV5_9BURK|nr:hypothetical protein [Paucibacter sp. R3-3]MDY0748701.1 hypothetical protein [Paucibacter sp. R3-3]